MNKEKNDKVKMLADKCQQMRRLIVKMIAEAGSGHPGGSLSCVEIMACLYFAVLNHRPHQPYWSQRDRFHLSKGHACPCWYAALSLSGYFEEKELWTLRKFGSLLQGHPDRRTPGVDVASGSLGQGLSVSIGMSLAAKIDQEERKVYCLLGDGELEEGNVWEAAMAAAHFKLDNLCAIVDYNRFQIDGSVEKIMNIEPLGDKWKAFGWKVREVDGHNIEELLEAFGSFKTTKGKPTVIIAHTIKGKGVSFMENVVDFHGRAPTKAETEKALKELGED
ncbi:MAG: transketolase [Candidatus Omnitrophica bacterium]|nr:transketolase [Candidatus Omnitrophota bacterium]